MPSVVLATRSRGKGLLPVIVRTALPHSSLIVIFVEITAIWASYRSELRLKFFFSLCLFFYLHFRTLFIYVTLIITFINHLKYAQERRNRQKLTSKYYYVKVSYHLFKYLFLKFRWNNFWRKTILYNFEKIKIEIIERRVQPRAAAEIRKVCGAVTAAENNLEVDVSVADYTQP